MSGKRYVNVSEKIKKMDPRKGIGPLIISIIILIWIIVSACITFVHANNIENTIAQVENNIEDNIIDHIHMESSGQEQVIAETAEETTPEEIIEEVNEETKETTVTYKNTKVVVPEVKKAEVNDVEDQKQSSSTAGTSTATTIDQAKSLYEQVGNSVGIDVSKWQGKIDWTQVKNAGVDFAIIRVGYRGSSQGSIVEDPYFERNVLGATENGIKVGIYFFSMALNEEEAIQEAAWVVKVIRKYSITYPVAYDFESWNSGRTAGISGEQATSNAIAFLGYIKSSGYSPMMYASKNDYNNRFKTSRLTGCKFWLAHYTTKTNYTGSYQMWQYSSKGSVAGINGYVDMNIAYFSYSNDVAPQHICKFELERVQKEATCTEEGEEIYRCACGDSKVEVSQAKGHTFGEWEITLEATENTQGEKTRICSICGEKETEIIPVLEKPNNENDKNNEDDKNNENNGDNENDEENKNQDNDLQDNNLYSGTLENDKNKTGYLS